MSTPIHSSQSVRFLEFLQLHLIFQNHAHPFFVFFEINPSWSFYDLSELCSEKYMSQNSPKEYRGAISIFSTELYTIWPSETVVLFIFSHSYWCCEFFITEKLTNSQCGDPDENLRKFRESKIIVNKRLQMQMEKY